MSTPISFRVEDEVKDRIVTETLVDSVTLQQFIRMAVENELNHRYRNIDEVNNPELKSFTRLAEKYFNTASKEEVKIIRVFMSTQLQMLKRETRRKGRRRKSRWDNMNTPSPTLDHLDLSLTDGS